jgi:hypothetical protein
MRQFHRPIAKWLGLNRRAFDQSDLPPIKRAKYGGLQVSELRRLKDLESDNAEQKRLLAKNDGYPGAYKAAIHEAINIARRSPDHAGAATRRDAE